MTTITEHSHAMAAQVSEADGFVCREVITIDQNQDLPACTVLGMIGTKTGAITVSAPTIVGTGNGVLTKASPAYGDGAQVGTYRVMVVSVAADVANFEVIRPDGTVDGVGSTGAAYGGYRDVIIPGAGQDSLAFGYYPELWSDAWG